VVIPILTSVFLALGSYCLRIACESGHIEVVRLLLRDGRIDVRAHNDEAFRKACYGGHFEIVELLLNLPGVDPSSEGSCFLPLP